MRRLDKQTVCDAEWEQEWRRAEREARNATRVQFYEEVLLEGVARSCCAVAVCAALVAAGAVMVRVFGL